MRALSNLINVNRPNLVLFVGEALVGNDAVDQLTKFNQRLADLANTPSPHTIDGIVLTKFDTIDDKVGYGVGYGVDTYGVGCGVMGLVMWRRDGMWSRQWLLCVCFFFSNQQRCAKYDVFQNLHTHTVQKNRWVQRCRWSTPVARPSCLWDVGRHMST